MDEVAIQTTQARKVDQVGRVYHTIYLSHKTNCCIALEEENLIVPVEPNFTLRLGNSKFGDEILVQLIQKGKIERYHKKSPERHIEFYLPKNAGIIAIQQALDYWRTVLQSKGLEGYM